MPIQLKNSSNGIEPANCFFTHIRNNINAINCINNEINTQMRATSVTCTSFHYFFLVHIDRDSEKNKKKIKNRFLFTFSRHNNFGAETVEWTFSKNR